MQYRDWIPTALRYRFGKRTTNFDKLNTGFEYSAEVEGYYRTTARFIWETAQEIRKGQMTFMECWHSLDDYELRNIKRAIAEVGQFLVLMVIIGLIGALKNRKDIWGDKTEKPLTLFQKALRYISYAATREKTELGALIPINPLMPLEGLKMLKSPFAATNILSDMGNLLQVFWIPSWFGEIESGYYKGHSTAYRAFMESPLTLWLNTVRRVLDPEQAERYFSRN